MKITQFLFPLFCFLFISCEKNDPKTELENLTDLIRGEYKCMSMRFEGDPVDLNNDGICKVDLKDEFSYFSYGSSVFMFPNFIHAVLEYDTEEIFKLTVPIQSVKYDKVRGQYSLLSGLSGGNSYVCFSYSVTTDGTFEFFTRNDQLDTSRYRDSEWETLGVDVSETRGVEVVSYNNGILVVRILGAYYDFHAGKMVNGPVELVYERVSYAVR